MVRRAAWVVVTAITLMGGAGGSLAQPIDYYAPPYPASAYLPPPAYVYPPPIGYERRGYFAPPIAYGYGPPLAGGYEPGVVIELPPPRPRSCGRYRYWNGDYCADARYERPYLGPKY